KKMQRPLRIALSPPQHPTSYLVPSLPWVADSSLSLRPPRPSLPLLAHRAPLPSEHLQKIPINVLFFEIEDKVQKIYPSFSKRSSSTVVVGVESGSSAKY
ncbi:hypothetical protein GOP47_0016151, partial [Adiantum capillus-veneris]